MRLLSGRAQSFPYGLDLQNSVVLSANNLSPSTAADLTDKPTRPGTETRSLLANPVTSQLSFGFPFVRPVNGDNYQQRGRAFQGPCDYDESSFIVLFPLWLGSQTEGRWPGSCGASLSGQVLPISSCFAAGVKRHKGEQRRAASPLICKKNTSQRNGLAAKRQNFLFLPLFPCPSSSGANDPQSRGCGESLLPLPVLVKCEENPQRASRGRRPCQLAHGDAGLSSPGTGDTLAKSVG